MKRRSDRIQKERLELDGAVEGQQELMYFNRLKELIEAEGLTNIKKVLVVKYDNAKGISPVNVVDQAMNILNLDIILTIM